MNERLFGTDGIRGRALEPPLDEDTLRRLGVALAAELAKDHASPHLLMAGDTRASTAILAGWLGAGFQAAGGQVTWGDVLPTPAVSHLLRHGSYSAGAVISASHNPAPDNGIKVLNRAGQKLGSAVEEKLEARLAEVEPLFGPDLPEADPALAERYIDLVVATHSEPSPLAGLDLVVDGANGAGSAVAGPLLERLGARVTATRTSPDGTNINQGCGATAPGHLQAKVAALRADGGLALDGDADRVILVDEGSNILDGDDILLAWARHLASRSLLPGRRVVATVMSNYGLEQALQRDGIELIRCPVGDRSVWLAMAEHGCTLGGEQSGHIICSHHSVSGDGLLTGSHVMAIAAQSCPVSHLTDLTRLPQLLRNVPVASKPAFTDLPGVVKELAAVEQCLAGRGRVLLRYSGTESLARVMVEGENADEIADLASRLVTALQDEIVA